MDSPPPLLANPGEKIGNLVPWNGNSNGCGILIFFLGENGDKCIVGMFDTNSTNHGLTRLTFCNKSGSSQATYNNQYNRNINKQTWILLKGRDFE